ncbi:MAG: CHC2 zinc finger domain-containing protein [Stellaceae bacterium]
MNRQLERIPESTLAAARAKRPLHEVVGRYVELKKAGAEWTGLCPFHTEKTPSFFVNDKKQFYHCFGCGAHGDAIAAVMQLGHRSFHDAVDGLIGAAYRSAPAEFDRRQREAAAEYAAAGDRRFDSDPDERARLAKARAMWENRKPLAGTVGEHYLTHVRGLRPPWPDVLGFAPSMFFQPQGVELPAVLARIVDGTGEGVALQRIFIDPCTGRKAEPAKQAKRTYGPMRDGAVKLFPADRMLGLAGSVEDALAARRIFRLPVWATCGENRLGAVAVPECVEHLVIFADSDRAGIREAIKASEEYEHRGLGVEITAPEDVKDWDEWLLAKREYA